MKLRRQRPPTAVLLILTGSLLGSACAGISRPRPAPAAAEAPADMDRAYALVKAGRPDDAAGVIERILSDDPDNREARKELAYLRIAAKRWKDAIALLDALIEEDPSDMRLRMERGYARQAAGEPAAAADEFGLVAREPGEFQEQAREALAGVTWELTPEARGIRSETLLDQGYDDLRRGDNAAAREKFLSALADDPGRTEVTKQLGYMSVADGKLSDAVKDFEGAHHLAPLDYETALELGYLYDSLHDEAGAEKAFAEALPSPDPKIRSEAASALSSIRGRSSSLYADIYASPYYTSRFADKIAFLEASVGYKPDPAGPFSAYLGSRYTQDSLSRSGAVPEIYSDNYVSVGPGIRYQPKGYNVNLSAEWDETVNLLRSSAHPDAVEADARVVLADYHYWDGPHKLFADAGGSVGYYSRYRNNVIAYLQTRGGVKAWDDGSSQLRLYAPINVFKDTNRDYYNNLVEIGVGAELQPFTKIDFKLRAEYLRGTYMGIQGQDPNPYGPHYNDVRILLIYSGHFTKQPAAEQDEPARKRGFVW